MSRLAEDDLEKRTQPGTHDGRPLPDCAARRAQVVANIADSSARTAPGRRALLDRFERHVDPDGVLSPAERARRAGRARKAYFARLALRSAQARRETPAVGDVDGGRKGPVEDLPQ